MSITPHGPGFSFVDSIELVAGHPPAMRSTKLLDPALPFFADHFPDRPMMPGVLIIEMAAQTAGALWGHLTGPAGSSMTAFSLAQVLDFRLRQAAGPGDKLVCEVALERDFGPLAQFTVEVRHAERDGLIANGKILLGRPPD